METRKPRKASDTRTELGSIDQADNRALRAAHALQVPLVYFVGTRPGRYRPFFPCFITADDPSSGCVLVGKGKMVGSFEELNQSSLRIRSFAST